MAADVQIRRLTGVGPTYTNITSVNTRISTSDNPYTTETANPIPIPSVGTNYSYWCVTRLFANTAPTGTIDNIKWYSDGTNSFGTGVSFNVATAGVYAQAAGTPAETGTQLTVANYGNGTTDLNGAPSDAFAYNSGAPLSVTGSIVGPTTGNFGDMAVFQSAVTTTADAGATAAETVTWQYDET